MTTNGLVVRLAHGALDGLASRLARGAVAGLAGTVSHTAVMWAARRVGVLGEPPPQKITRAIGKHVSPKLTRGAGLRAATVVSHVAFGAAIGMAYAGRHQADEVGVLSGIRFASAVWALSYGGWAPAIGAMPTLSHDRPGRPTAMWLAHVAFGATMAMTLRRLDGK